MNARQELAVSDTAPAGETVPSTELCARFDREPAQGRTRAHDDRLLTDASAHIRESPSLPRTRGLGSGRDFVLPKASGIPSEDKDFELTTWLVGRTRKEYPKRQKRY